LQVHITINIAVYNGETNKIAAKQRTTLVRNCKIIQYKLTCIIKRKINYILRVDKYLGLSKPADITVATNMM